MATIRFALLSAFNEPLALRAAEHFNKKMAEYRNGATAHVIPLSDEFREKMGPLKTLPQFGLEITYEQPIYFPLLERALLDTSPVLIA